MKKDQKLKLFGVAAVTAATLLFSVPVFAASNTVAITSATTSSGKVLANDAASAPAIEKAELVTINTTISSAGADVTLMVVNNAVDPTTSAVTEADIKYIDQDTSDGTTGNCSITFRMPLNVQAGTYAVYVAGEGVASKNTKYLKIADSSGGETYICGDIDQNKEVDGTDAMWALRYELGIAPPAGLDIDAGDVNNDTEVDGIDAMWMLRYELGIPLPSGIDAGVEKTK